MFSNPPDSRKKRFRLIAEKGPRRPSIERRDCRKRFLKTFRRKTGRTMEASDLAGVFPRSWVEPIFLVDYRGWKIYEFAAQRAKGWPAHLNICLNIMGHRRSRAKDGPSFRRRKLPTKKKLRP